MELTRLRRLAPDAELRRILLLSGLAAIIGQAAGGAAFLLLKLIALISNVALFGQIGWTLPPSSSIQSSPRLVIVAMLGGLVVALLAKWAPVIKGHGIPEAMEAVLVRESRIAPRVAVAKPLSAAVAIGTGGPFGAEGPIIVTGGAIGSLAGQVLSVSASERKILLSVGAAAGMAATFGAPLAAVVLAIELLLFEYSLRALVPLLVGTSVAAGVHAAIFGSGALFAVATHDYFGLPDLPAFALLGGACGLLAVVICKGLFLVEAGFRRLPVPSFWHPVIGGLGFGLVGLVVPGALGVGYDEIGDVLLGRLAVGTIAVLLVGKLLAWWIALGSGTSGGTLAPILLISGCFGSLFAEVVNHVAPGLHASPTAFALVAMAATFAAATRTPLTSIVFVFELTRDYQAVLPLMGTTVVAVLVAQWLMTDSIMTEKLTRRGLRVRGDYEVDRSRTTFVREVMTVDPITLDRDATIGSAHDHVGHSSHAIYPVLDRRGLPSGTITGQDIATAPHPEAPVASLARALPEPGGFDPAGAVITAEPDETVHDLRARLLAVGADMALILDDERLVGVCTRTDILQPHRAQLDHEQRAAGWVQRAGR